MSFLRKVVEKVTPPKVKLDLKLSGLVVELGRELEGTLQVVAEEPVNADEVRIEVSCTEHNRVQRQTYDPQLQRYVTRDVWESANLLDQKLPLSGPLRFEPGSAATFRFDVSVPPSLPPTFKSATRRVEWKVKGVVAVRGRPDATSRTVEITVIQPGAVKRTLRCPYCGTAYPEDLLSCPHCGAPRSA